VKTHDFVSHLFAARVAFVALLSLSATACSRQKTAVPDPTALLQSVPSADPGKYERVSDMQGWRNPYLLVRSDGIALLDTADSAEIILKPNEVLATLAKLPASAWPYGRVVAIAVSHAGASSQDAVEIRRYKGIVGGILEDAHVAIDWVPTA
jgi:hypothetical protein